MKHTRQQSGVTLIEAVITILIVAIGMLGMAALQSASLRLAYNSYERTQANFLVSDLIDRIKMNPENFVELPAAVTVSQGSPDCLGGDACTPQQLVTFEQASWLNSAQGLLPNVTATLNEDGSMRGTFDLTVSWQRATPAPDPDDPDPDGDNNQASENTFTYRFRSRR